MDLLKSSVRLTKTCRARIVCQALFKHSPWVLSPSAKPNPPMAHWVPLHISWSSCLPAIQPPRHSDSEMAPANVHTYFLLFESVWFPSWPSVSWGSNRLILHYLNLIDSWVWTVSVWIVREMCTVSQALWIKRQGTASVLSACKEAKWMGDSNSSWKLPQKRDAQNALGTQEGATSCYARVRDFCFEGQEMYPKLVKMS